MTRQEHLAWAKARALEYVGRGDLEGAVMSMASDLNKHDELMNPAIGLMVVEAFMFEVDKGPAAVRRWVEGFN